MRTAIRWLAVAIGTSLGFAQTPLVSPRQFLSGDAALASSTGNQRTPSIAAGGGGFLLAWADGRAIMQGGDDTVESSDDIWFQRLDSQGLPLDPTPKRIAVSAERDVLPRVTWNGSMWLVSWVMQPFTASNTFSKVLAVRIDATGTILDAQPLTLFSGTIYSHSAASDGQNWVVVARTQAGGVRARRVSTAPTNPAAPAVTLTTDPAQACDIGSAQGNYLLAWSWLGPTGTIDLLGRRFDANLNSLDPTPIVIAATAINDDAPRVGSNGSEYLVGWGDFDSNSFSGSLRCSRVSTAGTVLGQQQVTFYWFGGYSPTDIAWDGAQWFIAYGGQRMARVSAAGVVLDFDGFFVRPLDGVSRNGLTAAGAVSGGVCAAWSVTTPTTLLTGTPRYEVKGSRVLSPANVGTDLFPAASAPAQAMPALVSNGAGSAMLLRSETAGQTRLMFVGLDAQGAALTAQPIQVASAVDIRHPTLAWDGSRYIAAWIHGAGQAGSTIRARRIAANGALLDVADIVLDTAAPGAWPCVDAVGNSGEFLVSGIRSNDLAVWQIRGSDGAILSGPTVVTGGNPRKVTVCAIPGGYAVGWHEWIYPSAYGYIRAALVSSLGVVSPPFFAVGGTNRIFTSVSVATSGNELLFAWDEGIDYDGDRHVDAQRFDFAGAPLDPSPFPVAASATSEQFFPDLSWDGSQYICAYQELGHVLSSDTRAARISAAGVVLDAQGFELEGSADSEGQPAVQGLGGGRSVVASSILRTDTSFGAYRVATRIVFDGCPTPTTYCTAKLNSQQCLPAIAISGAPSASGAGTCVATGTNVLDNVVGLFLYGYQTASVPFQGGFLCIAPPRRRTPLQNSGAAGSSNPCAGQFTFDLNAFIASGIDPLLQIPGQFFACQFWSRDSGDPFGTNLTDAVHGQVCY